MINEILDIPVGSKICEYTQFVIDVTYLPSYYSPYLYMLLIRRESKDVNFVPIQKLQLLLFWDVMQRLPGRI